MSHSGLLVVVALGINGPLGVDVQRLADLPDPGRGPAWVRREAMFKADAAGAETPGRRSGGSFLALEALLQGYAAGLAVQTLADARGAVRWIDAAYKGGWGSTPRG